MVYTHSCNVIPEKCAGIITYQVITLFSCKVPCASCLKTVTYTLDKNIFRFYDSKCLCIIVYYLYKKVIYFAGLHHVVADSIHLGGVNAQWYTSWLSQISESYCRELTNKATYQCWNVIHEMLIFVFCLGTWVQMVSFKLLFKIWNWNIHSLNLFCQWDLV